MLVIDIPPTEMWNEEENLFMEIPAKRLYMEHSLKSIAEWESKYKRAFLNERNQLNAEELMDYILMMCIPRQYDRSVLDGLTKTNLNDIEKYLSDKPSATTLPKQQGAPSREIITSELIYTWMVQEQIPFDCENWNIQRLLILINYVAIKNQPSKKMNKGETMKQHVSLNKARRAQRAKGHIPHI